MKRASEQPVPALGSGSFFLLLPLALLLAEAACGSSLSSNDRLFLFGNRKDTVAATFFTLSQNMKLEFSDAREVLAPCVHVVGTWALNFFAPLSVSRA